MQQAATTENLLAEIVAFLENPHAWDSRLERFQQIHQQLARNASARAVDAVLKLAGIDQVGKP